MLMPKRVKRRKQFRGTMKGKALRGNQITNGEYGIVATEPCWIRSNQIEAARIAMTRYIKRGGKVWIKIFPDKPVTTKPAETRMGSGKGTLEYWVAVVKPGRVLFEIAGVPEEVAKEALRLATHKQIEAARIAMTRYIKRGGKVWIKIFPDKPVTTKPAETRMGSGKGTLEYWVAVVKPGRVLFEIAGVPEEVAKEALRLATHKLPCKCKVVSRADLEGGDNSEN